jgi:hypothetical protein
MNNMQENIKYIQNQLANSLARLKGFTRDEATGQDYYKRQFYIKAEKYLKDFMGGNSSDRWLIIPGLRGVGKTTILAQLFVNYLPQVEPNRMLYIALDDVVKVLGSNLNDILRAYEELLGENFEKLTKPVFLFIDEVQYDPRWAAVLKSLYDKSKRVFIICTGSSALSLQTNPDVTRRAIFQKLFPANFCEYVMIKDGKLPIGNLKQRIRNAMFGANSAAEAHQQLKSLEREIIQFWSSIDKNYIEKYLRVGTLPFAIKISDEASVYQRINQLIEQTINADVQNLGKFDQKTLSLIKRLLFLLAECDQVSVHNMARTLELSPNTIMSVLDTLESAEVLIRVMPQGAHDKKVRKPSRYPFMSSAIRASLLSVAGNEQIFSQQQGRLMEDIAAMTLYREYVSPGAGSLTYDSSDAGADFILSLKARSVIPIEIGMTDKGTKGVQQVKNTMKKVKISTYGVIIAKNNLELVKDENLVIVPLEYFLLI